MVALTNQVTITNQIAEQFQTTPKAEDYARLTDVFKTFQKASVKAVALLATVIGKMEQRMQQWEEAFLPHVLERLPTPVPPSPNDTQEEIDITQLYGERVSTHEGKQAQPQALQDQQGRLESDQVHGAQHQQQAVTDQHASPEPSSNVAEGESLQPMQERSLRNCCARIVRPSGQTNAMRPFRA